MIDVPRPIHRHGIAAIFAHPDDETFSTAGVMAEAVSRGIPVTVICATRGEAGDSSIAGLDTPELLGAVREQELRRAMAALGVHDVRLLGYRDSGMPGSRHNADPRAFANADEAVVAAQVAIAVRDIQPAVVVTFGEDGIYGHADHLVSHRTTIEAVRLAADPAFLGEVAPAWAIAALYFASAPREELIAMFERRGKPGNGMPPEMIARMGTPRAEITHWLDVARWSDQKEAAARAHRTQTAPGGPLTGMAEEDFRRRMTREMFVRASLPWEVDGVDALSAVDVIDDLARTSPRT